MTGRDAPEGRADTSSGASIGTSSEASTDAPSGADARELPDGGVRTYVGTEESERTSRLPVPEWVWPVLAPSLAVAVVVAYLVGHTYPGYGAGFYLQVAEQILRGGYALPTHIPLYTDGGVPFAYPPLMFYVSAVLLDAGLRPLTVSFLVPSLAVVGISVVYYGIARELLPTREQAGVAAGLFVVTPPLLQWHLSAGGLVRGPAFLFALAGCYVGLQVFAHGRRTWVFPGVALFALTMLTHPVYTVFFGLSWVLLFLAFDRTLTGLVAGAAVAGGGVLLTAPWWWTVAQTHGFGIFFAAAGTHNGLAGGLGRLVDQFVYSLDSDVEAMYFVGVYLAAAYHVWRRRWFLPAWMVASAYVVGKERFQFVAGALMLAAFCFEAAELAVTRHTRRVDVRRAAMALSLVVLVVFAGVGTLYAAGAMNFNHEHSPTQPAFVDEEDRAAMAWVEANTDPDADFVVLGDAAEWFPLFTDRSILVGPWGVEWTSPAEYETQLDRYVATSTTSSETALTADLSQVDERPEYLYVPKGEYTVRGQEHVADAGLRRELANSVRYRRVYENSGVVVYRITELHEHAGRGP